MGATYDSDQLLDAIVTSLDDDKAEEIVKINLRGKSEMGDWMVIASGRSTRQVSAMAEKLTDTPCRVSPPTPVGLLREVT